MAEKDIIEKLKTADVASMFGPPRPAIKLGVHECSNCGDEKYASKEWDFHCKNCGKKGKLIKKVSS